MKMTSNTTSNFSQIMFSPPSGFPAINCMVNTMALISAGNIKGYTSNGAINSRSRIFTVRALKIVPITVSPQVPNTNTKSKDQIRLVQCTL